MEEARVEEVIVEVAETEVAEKIAAGVVAEAVAEDTAVGTVMAAAAVSERAELAVEEAVRDGDAAATPAETGEKLSGS